MCMHKIYNCFKSHEDLHTLLPLHDFAFLFVGVKRSTVKVEYQRRKTVSQWIFFLNLFKVKKEALLSYLVSTDDANCAIWAQKMHFQFNLTSDMEINQRQ